MTYQGALAGRVVAEASDLGRVAIWAFADVEDALVEAVRMLWRLPGEGRMPFATDAPWHLITREARHEAGGLANIEAWRVEQEVERMRDERNRARTGPLTSEEVTCMEATLAWLEHVPERDRKLVVLALQQLASGAARVRWSVVRAGLVFSGVAEQVGDRALGMRYMRALQGLARRLSAKKVA